MSKTLDAPRRPTGDEALFLQRVRPVDWKNPEPRDCYDLTIIGAGPAGIVAAKLAARLGFSVALVERNRIGGNSLNSGSIPSKAIIRTARVSADIHEAEVFGAPAPHENVPDFSAALARMRRIRTRIAEFHSVDSLVALGVQVFFGDARFETRDTLVIGESRLKFTKCLVATGARPRTSNIPGLNQIGYCTSDTIFEMSTLPKRLVVVGGGPLGCELAQAFCRLGPHVTIVQDEPKFLPGEERDAAEILSWSMARDGVEIHLNTSVVGVREVGGTKVLETVNNEVRSTIQADEILLCIGRVPNVEDLGLESAAIELGSDGGIRVDDFLCTSNPSVYAAGDVCMPYKFTNAAQASARMAVQNALLSGRQRHTELTIPWCTFCDPEIAHVGLRVLEARQRSIPIKSLTIMMQDVDRAITDGQDVGYLKIHIEDGTDNILGATIVASRASELVNEMAVVLGSGIGMNKLASIVHTYPTESRAISLAALAYVRAQSINS